MINPNESPMKFIEKVNVKETLQKLHTEFPNLSLDELFKILDCITLYTDILLEEPKSRIIY